MKYPHGRCPDCGDRLFDTIEGSLNCFNCERIRRREENEKDRAVERRYA